MVGIVAVMPCYSMGGMVRITSEVRPPCIRSLALRRRLRRGSVCARAQGVGSGEMELASEAKGSGETELVPKPREV